MIGGIKEKQKPAAGALLLPPFEEEDQNITQYTPFDESQEQKEGGTTVMSYQQLTSEGAPKSEEIIEEEILNRTE